MRRKDYDAQDVVKKRQNRHKGLPSRGFGHFRNWKLENKGAS